MMSDIHYSKLKNAEGELLPSISFVGGTKLSIYTHCMFMRMSWVRTLLFSICCFLAWFIGISMLVYILGCWFFCLNCLSFEVLYSMLFSVDKSLMLNSITHNKTRMYTLLLISPLPPKKRKKKKDITLLLGIGHILAWEGLKISITWQFNGDQLKQLK